MHILKKKTKGFIVTILIIIVIALIGLLIYANFFYKSEEEVKKKDNEPNNGFETKYDNYTGDTNKDAGDQNNVNDANGNRFNTSKKLKENHSLKDLTVSDFKIRSNYEYPELATLTFNLTNNTSSKISNPILKFNFYSSDNKLLSEYEFSIDAVLPPDVPLTFSVEVRERVIDAYDFSFEVLDESSVGGVG